MFLTSALAGVEWSASHPGRFTPGEIVPATHWIGSWVDPRAGLDDVEKSIFLPLPELGPGPLCRPPVASCYTDCAIPDSIVYIYMYTLKFFPRISFYWYIKVACSQNLSLLQSTRCFKIKELLSLFYSDSALVHISTPKAWRKLQADGVSSGKKFLGKLMRPLGCSTGVHQDSIISKVSHPLHICNYWLLNGITGIIYRCVYNLHLY
jgi:hypothetical protein